MQTFHQVRPAQIYLVSYSPGEPWVELCICKSTSIKFVEENRRYLITLASNFYFLRQKPFSNITSQGRSKDKLFHEKTFVCLYLSLVPLSHPSIASRQSSF